MEDLPASFFVVMVFTGAGDGMSVRFLGGGKSVAYAVFEVLVEVATAVQTCPVKEHFT